MTEKQIKKIFKMQSEEVHCPGCGERIYEHDDFSKIEYVKTKRGTHLFIHEDCVDKVWKGVIEIETRKR